MVAFCVQSLLCILGVASLATAAAVDTTQAWQLSQYCWANTNAGNQFYTVNNGDTCWDIIAHNQNRFTMTQLLCWNTDINPWCSNLIPGRQVCIGVERPGPIC
ncbi:hypothetical protein N7457_003358 [Penicillium paradoxum]|uniref:uncharacterized protein n=1 Tax=Penicillium paradoxum TaxID=176176 RepID=UPI002549BF13|nr:uncharacterized protein N7457_003358 [Penicillium paradoxum]KAJ5788368.1 hypothetical protein N7457_003358 [Penicillium paradoxum]